MSVSTGHREPFTRRGHRTDFGQRGWRLCARMSDILGLPKSSGPDPFRRRFLHRNENYRVPIIQSIFVPAAGRLRSPGAGRWLFDATGEGPGRRPGPDSGERASGERVHAR